MLRHGALQKCAGGVRAGVYGNGQVVVAGTEIPVAGGGKTIQNTQYMLVKAGTCRLRKYACRRQWYQ